MAPEKHEPNTATPPAWAVVPFYWSMTRLMALVVATFGRWRVRGSSNVPPGGGVLIVSNHLHNADPPRFVEVLGKWAKSLPV